MMNRKAMKRDDWAKRNADFAVSACLLEATARKPGNVHPQASFADLTYRDFVRSARLIGPSIEQARDWPVGRIVLDAVEKTQGELHRNTNLGILLLLRAARACRKACWSATVSTACWPG